MDLANFLKNYGYTDVILLSKNTTYSVYKGIEGTKLDSNGILLEDAIYLCFGSLENPSITIEPFLHINKENTRMELSTGPTPIYINAPSYRIFNYGEKIEKGDSFGGVNISCTKEGVISIYEYFPTELNKDEFVFSCNFTNACHNYIDLEEIRNITVDKEGNIVNLEMENPISSKTLDNRYMVFGDSINIINVSSRYLPYESIGEAIQQWLIENNYTTAILLYSHLSNPILTREKVGFFINIFNLPSIKKICWRDPFKKK